ncbi:hypothetical protein [Frigoriflavimonas asaccharolytica]|uniref:Uncharacterized protein YeeX (DUF496 family) n=1 Tax=Frigoriflavimonas asaccharolytica TaxID=2735899 RepID=A0A8J8K401_9FLAO|nr:hypothetical protein [Frigoriflavimonas asaccharolytica]NRS91185.1 uncharacterized protein YeeX (DUF496 family) [Frigoriflavimonas asaccharolytica]
MKPHLSLLLLFTLIFCNSQQITVNVPFKKIKLFNKEFVIPDINKSKEKLSSCEKKVFDNKNKIAKNTAVEKRKSLKEYEGTMAMPDTINVSLTEYNSNSSTIQYNFNQTNSFSIMTYYDSDPLLQDKSLRDDFFNSQPMLFKEYRGYYSNGSLNLKRLSYSAITIKQYEFDENGNLVKEFDLSKKYNLSVLDVLKILNVNDVVIDFQINRLSTDPHTILMCAETNRGKVWYLGQGEEEKEYLILDNNREYVSQQMNENKAGNFKFLDSNDYKNQYGDKMIGEVELKTGFMFFVYDRVN